MPENSGNRGEWSEIYAFIKLLKDGKIYAADKDLRRIGGNNFFPIIRILREEVVGEKYDYHTGDKIKIYHNGELVSELDIYEFDVQAEFLYEKIFRQERGNIRLNELGPLSDFLKKVFVTKIKAGSKEKADIVMEIHDINTGYKPVVGFSIKSQIGSPSSLLNASGATNIVYRINGIDDTVMERINSIETREKIIDRFTEIYSAADSVEFFGLSNSVFKDNLELIDSKMPEILACAMEYRYRDNIKNYGEIVDLLVRDNPMEYNNSEIYRYKFKKLLSATALGMKPATRWDGINEANGGYVIVKTDGEILAYYIYNMEAFEDYLLKNTYLESGSTSRHGYATIYKENEEYFVNMNIQIRFKA